MSPPSKPKEITDGSMELFADFLVFHRPRQSPSIGEATDADHIVVWALAALFAPRIVRIDPVQQQMLLKPMMFNHSSSCCGADNA